MNSSTGIAEPVKEKGVIFSKAISKKLILVFNYLGGGGRWWGRTFLALQLNESVEEILIQKQLEQLEIVINQSFYEISEDSCGRLMKEHKEASSSAMKSSSITRTNAFCLIRR